MKLTDKQIDFISNNISFYGVHSNELKEDLLDHICTAIENSNSNDFETTYKKVIQQFGGYASITQTQEETQFQLHTRKAIRYKKALFFTGYITTSILSLGLLFKFMHWPYAGMFLALGFLFLILICLPLFFLERHLLSLLHHQS